MKKLILLLLLAFASAISSQADVYVLTKDLPYTGNTILKGGEGKAFPMAEFKEELKSGKRVIALGYTRLNGWVMSMAENTGIRLQHISMTTEWPSEWIEKEKEEGFQISSIGYGQGQWCVITSLNCGLSQQVYKQGEWEELRMFIREQLRGNDRFITSFCCDENNKWVVVMSFNDETNGQRYDFKNRWKQMAPLIDHYRANDYYIQAISFGAGNVGVVFNMGDGETTPQQECVTDPLSLPEYISDGYTVTQIANNL